MLRNNLETQETPAEARLRLSLFNALRNTFRTYHKEAVIPNGVPTVALLSGSSPRPDAQQTTCEFLLSSRADYKEQEQLYTIGLDIDKRDAVEFYFVGDQYATNEKHCYGLDVETLGYLGHLLSNASFDFEIAEQLGGRLRLQQT